MKTKPKPKYMPYPKYVKQESGCKVSWLFYDNKADAQAASKAARHNGEIDAGYGYDFGYCSPGGIDENWEPGLYRVCIP